MCKILNEVELVAVVIIRKLRPYPSTKQPPLNGPQNGIFDSVFKHGKTHSKFLKLTSEVLFVHLSSL